ncbi:MAG: hypothetical protein ACXVYV_01270 [Gaiellales bacterium]
MSPSLTRTSLENGPDPNELLTIGWYNAHVAKNATRITQARRRTHLAKTTLLAVGAAAFGLGILAVRGTAPSHAKGNPRPLGAPPGFVRELRQSSLAGGQIAPPQAPPQSVTGLS